MTPDRSWSTRCRSCCSFFSSSFWKSSARRAASRRLRSDASSLSRRASALISGPLFSHSSRRASSSLRLASTFFCIPRLSFSRLSPAPAAAPLLQICQIDLRPDPVHVPDIKDPGETEADRQRDDVLRVAEHLSRAADSLAGVVFRRDRVELEAPDRVGPAEVEPLEE